MAARMLVDAGADGPAPLSVSQWPSAALGVAPSLHAPGRWSIWVRDPDDPSDTSKAFRIADADVPEMRQLVADQRDAPRMLAPMPWRASALVWMVRGHVALVELATDFDPRSETAQGLMVAAARAIDSDPLFASEAEDPCPIVASPVLDAPARDVAGRQS